MPENVCQSKYWCFTINNQIDEWRDSISPQAKLSFLATEVIFCIWQIEEAPTTARQHVQGYIELAKRLRRNQLSRVFGSGVHLEKRKGTRQQAKEYCEKSETKVSGPFSFGTWVEENKVTKPDTLQDIKAALDNGASLANISDKYFRHYLRYAKAFTQYKLLKSEPRSEKTTTIVVYGPTGTGKSHWARANYPDAYWKTNNKWWDLYEDQQTVICDEFYGWIPYTVLLRITDKYPCLVETKFGHVNFTAKTIIFLSNDRISEWYKPEIMAKNAFFRRIDKFIHMPSRDTIIETSYSEATLMNLT